MGRNSTNNDNSAVGAEFASVVSPNGFSTGDLVYRSSSGYGVMPSGAVSSATFGQYPAPVDSPPLARSSTVGTHLGIGCGCYDTIAAKLTNGNIVVAYTKNYVVYFTIYDANNNVVVPEVNVQSGQSAGSNLVAASVVALSGGGFVIWWYSQASSAYYHRGFDNSGVATYAGTSTGVNAASYQYDYSVLKLYARSDNRYVVIYRNSTNNAAFAVYNANGTVYAAATNIGGTDVYGWAFEVVVFADNSFLISLIRNSAATLFWFRRNADGTAATSGSFSATTNGGMSTVLLNNGNAAFYYRNTSSILSFRSFTTSSNTVGSEVNLYASALADSAVSPICAYTIPGTNSNIVFFTWNTGGPYNVFSSLCYSVVDGTTGVVTQYNTAPGNIQSVIFSRFNIMTFVAIGSYVRAYMRTVGLSFPTDLSTNPTTGITNYIEVDTSSYVPNIFTSVDKYSASGSFSTGNYAKGSSTPASAVFYASSTSNSVVASPSIGTVLFSQTVVDTISVSSMKFLKLINGNILVVYGDSTNVRFKVYDLSLGQVASVSVETGATTGTYPEAIQFPDGKIAISYHYSSANTVVYKVFSSSYSEIQGRTTLSTTVLTSGVYSTCALQSSSNKIVCANINFSGLYDIIIRDEAGASIYSVTDQGVASIYGITVTAQDNETFNVTSASGGSLYLGFWWKTTATNWTSGGGGTSGFNIPAAYVSNVRYAAAIPGGTVGGGSPQSGTNSLYIGTRALIGPAGGVNFQNQSFTMPTGGVILDTCATADGLICVIAETNTSPTAPQLYTFIPTNAGITGVQAGSTSAVLSSVLNTAGAKSPTVAHFYGPYVAVGCRNSSGYPTIGVMVPFSRSTSLSVVAGVTASAPVTIDPSTGFSLIGVAASDCAAGGAGQVQTKGTAVLSSSYPTTTQTFDFTNPATYGVKGTVSNRVITLED